MAYELTTWIFQDSEKMSADYRGIMNEPYTKFSDVADQLQTLRETGLAKGDKRIDTYLRKVNVFSQNAPFDVSSEIEKNNNNWKEKIETQLSNANTPDDIGNIRDEIAAEKGKYEEDIVQAIETAIVERESALAAQIPEDFLTPKQKENITDVLGLPDEALESIGMRQIQRQLEEQVRDSIETATTQEELNAAEADLSIIPTKSGIKRLRREIQEKRNELEVD